MYKIHTYPKVQEKRCYSKKMKKVLVLINKFKDADLSLTSNIASYLSSKGVEVFLEEELALKVNGTKKISEATLKDISFLIVIGGDGTILGNAKKYKDYEFPILGINLGRVGCLAEAEPDKYQDAIDKILSGKYKVEKRVSLEGTLKKTNGEVKNIFAFNEVVVQRGISLKMLDLHISINNSNETSFYADGLIIATPTGSSAYSLASGGPLMYPTAKSFVLTPICAQLKTITSLVVSSDDVITMSIGQHKITNFVPNIEIDGSETLEIEPGDVLTVAKGSKTLNIIKVNLNSSLYEPIFKVTNTFVR